MPNIYYDPEAFGLTQVGVVDFSSGSYEFDYLVVWKDDHGTLYYGEDSGCSCPMPFEDTGRSHLIESTAFGVIAKIQNRLGSREEWRTRYGHTETSAMALIERLASGRY